MFLFLCVSLGCSRNLPGDYNVDYFVGSQWSLHALYTFFSGLEFTKF